MVKIKRKGNKERVCNHWNTYKKGPTLFKQSLYAMKKFFWNHKTVHVTRRFQYSAYQGRRDLNGNS